MFWLNSKYTCKHIRYKYCHVDECHFLLKFLNFICHKLRTNTKILFFYYIRTNMYFAHDLFGKMTLDL